MALSTRTAPLRLVGVLSLTLAMAAMSLVRPAQVRPVPWVAPPVAGAVLGAARPPEMETLRCSSRIHGKVDDLTLEVKCDSRRCGAGKGIVVLHYFSIATWELLETKKFTDPQALFTGKEIANAAHHHSASVRTA
jgi:hypothetical protein